MAGVDKNQTDDATMRYNVPNRTVYAKWELLKPMLKETEG